MKPWIRHGINIFLLGFVTFLVFQVPLLTGTMPLHTDGQHMTFPAFSYFKAWALKGQYPVWWVAGTVCGNMADTGSAGPAWQIFTPLYLGLDLETAWFLALLLQFFLAGLFMYLYLFQMTSHGFVSLFGALLFMRSEWVVETVVEPQMQLFLYPLILFWLERLVRTLQIRYVLLAGLTSACFFLGSNVHYPLYLIPCAFLYYFIRAGQQKKSLLLLDKRFTHFGMALIFLFVSLVWFRPYMLAAAGIDSTRQTLKESLPLFVDPLSLLTNFFPDLFSGPSVQFPHIYDRLVRGLTSGLLEKTMMPLPVAYPGLFAIFLLACAWSSRKNTAWAAGHWVIFSIFMVYTLLGDSLLYPILKKIPLVNMITNPQRISVLASETLPVLAAVGLFQIIRQGSQEKSEVSTFNIWFKRFFIFYALIFLVFSFKDLAFQMGGADGKGLVQEQLGEWIKAHPALYYQPAEFYQSRAEEFLAWLASWGSAHSLAILLPFLLFLGGGFIYSLWRTDTVSPSAAGILLLSLFIWDGFMLHPLPLNTLVARGHAYPTTSVISFLQNDPSLSRIFSLKPAKEPPFRQAHSQFLPADKQLVYGLSSPHGYQALFSRRYAEVFQALSESKELELIRLQDAYRYNKKLLDFLNIKYVITNRSESLPDQELIFEDSSYKIYLNPDAFPRAFLVPHSVKIERRGESLKKMLEEKTDLNKIVFLEGNNAPEIDASSSAGQDKVNLLKYTPHEILLETRADGRRILVLSDAYHPGWRCEVDGQNAQIDIANHAFRGVLLPAGRHQVRFFFRPFSCRLYAAGLGTSFLVLVMLFITYRKKQLRLAS